MILVFGGTTEGKRAISLLNEMKLQFTYSTKTNFQVDTGQFGIHRFGAFTNESLSEFLIDENISTIIHAAHPFAEELTRIVQKIGTKLAIPVIKWGRNTTVFPKENKGDIHLVDGYNEAIEMLNQLGTRSLLALTGVQSIEKLAPFWSSNNAVFRILDRPESKEIAEKSEFPSGQLILGYPNKSVEAERSLIQKHRIDAILSKDSGLSGSLDIKIQACAKEGIPLIVLKRPDNPSSFMVVTTVEECKNVLLNQTALWG